MNRPLDTIAPPVAALALLLGTWEVLVRALAVPTFLLPPPSAIAAAATSGPAEGRTETRQIASSATA